VPKRDKSAEEELRRREQVAESANETAIDGDERKLRHRHRRHFSASVKQVIAILADHPCART
jgi:hypothetical protein